LRLVDLIERLLHRLGGIDVLQLHLVDADTHDVLGGERLHLGERLGFNLLPADGNDLVDGAIADEAFLAVMAGQDPETGRDLGRRFGEGSVRGYDATFSAPKSVSVLFGVGEPEVRRQVAEAHEAAVEAVLGWVETRAHTRMRHRGHIVCIDAEGIVVAVFRQHTSRRLDPGVSERLCKGVAPVIAM